MYAIRSYYGLQGSTGLRGGLVLIPMGFINELHEPPTYLGTLRPETERFIIPTTWREYPTTVGLPVVPEEE